MNKIEELSFQIHDEIIASKQYKNMKEKENAMENDPSLQVLFADYKKMQEEYVYQKTDENLKKLHEIKYEIDNNKLVKDYNQAYKEYRLYLTCIYDGVFKNILPSFDEFEIIKNIKCK